MDEPTNDLDIETLELLEQMLMDYPGTLILISHDRAFINQVVTSVLVYEGKGHFEEFVGGYDDYKSYKKQKVVEAKTSIVKRTPNNNKLSFNEQRELALLPKQIEALEKKINELQLKMAEPEFYQQDALVIADINQRLAVDEAELATCYERWEALEERQ
jgi:ATP-binding cassette subfamily F protein uup